MKPLCIYHGACDDGFAAAWCVRKALGDGNVDFHPGVYGEDPPDVAGRDVIMVDFSYKRGVIGAMAGGRGYGKSGARSILILDHHKTAEEELRGLIDPPAGGWKEWLFAVALLSGNEPPTVCVGAIFDMERSGATMAWDYFVGGPRPVLIQYVEDRDLWRKQLRMGDEFSIALRSYPQDFEVWDRIERNTSVLFAEGTAIQRYYRLRVEEMKRNAFEAVVAGRMCVAANAPYFAASEVAGEISERHGVGLCFFQLANGRWQYSLRSRGGIDVSAIAKQFGGGGHEAAAGFEVAQPVHMRVEG